MPSSKLKRFLNEQQIKYQVISHSLAYTALEVAQAARISGYELAKTVIVKADGKMIMVVLPARYKLDLALVKKERNANLVSIASEEEFAMHFPDCEIGAMPPFGHLYELPVYVAKELTHDQTIAFNAGSHLEVIKMAYADYARLEKPIVTELVQEPTEDG